MTGLIYDPEAEKRSLMSKQETICNGQKTGRCCAFYWAYTTKVASNNPDNLKSGQKVRVCLRSPAEDFGFSDESMPVSCNIYKARAKTLKEWLRIVPDAGAFDAKFDSYDPLTPEEIRELQKGSKPIPVYEETITKTANVEKELPATPGITAAQALENMKDEKNA